MKMLSQRKLQGLHLGRVKARNQKNGKRALVQSRVCRALYVCIINVYICTNKQKNTGYNLRYLIVLEILDMLRISCETEGSLGLVVSWSLGLFDSTAKFLFALTIVL